MLVPECPSHMDTRGISCVLAAAYEANEWRRALRGSVMPAISAIFLRQRPWRFSYNLSISSGAGSYSAKASQALAAAGSGTNRCFPVLAMEAETNTSSFSSRMASGVILTHSERRSPQKAARTNRNNIPLSCQIFLVRTRYHPVAISVFPTINRATGYFPLQVFQGFTYYQIQRERRLLGYFIIDVPEFSP